LPFPHLPFAKKEVALVSETGASARAQLIKTRRGTQIDESLIPAARQECLEILQIACEAVSEGITESIRNVRQPLEEDSFWSEFCDRAGYRTLARHELDTLLKEIGKYRTPEESEARSRAINSANASYLAFQDKPLTCGCCGRNLSSEEPAYFGARVYVGIWPLYWNMFSKPQFCKLDYERTILCDSCAPEWLSPESDDVVTQLCAHCERPMVYRLTPSEIRRMFCSATCNQAYHTNLRKQERAKVREKVCEICGKAFTATRRDAKTCSKKCKQKAYRRRKREVRESR